MIDLTTPMGAVFSPDGRYRYALWRMWDPSVPPLMFIGLNPSTASETTNDPTITRMIHRAMKDAFLGRREYGGLLVGNLYSLVSTDPKALADELFPLLEEDVTCSYLAQMIKLAGRVLVGWGAFPEAAERAPIVLKMVNEPYCLGLTADGHPKHPLYIPYSTPMVRMKEVAGGQG